MSSFRRKIETTLADDEVSEAKEFRGKFNVAVYPEDTTWSGSVGLQACYDIDAQTPEWVTVKEFVDTKGEGECACDPLKVFGTSAKVVVFEPEAGVHYRFSTEAPFGVNTPSVRIRISN